MGINVARHIKILVACEGQPKKLDSHQFAPSAPNAMRSSLTAVAASSKFSADMAHFACFVASMIESSSFLNEPCENCWGGRTACWVYGLWCDGETYCCRGGGCCKDCIVFCGGCCCGAVDGGNATF